MRHGRAVFAVHRALIACAAAAVLSSTPAVAQAWLPPQGEAWFSLGYGNVFSDRHYFGNDAHPGDQVQIDYGHIRAQSVGMQLGYGLTDRLALSVGIPFVVSKYEGENAHNPFNRNRVEGFRFLDDGQYHGMFQDYTINLRYQALRGPLAVAPFAAAVIPSHSYEYWAHSAAGRDLHEYLLGLSFGGRLDRILPGSYVEATYSYAFVERVLGVHHDRSDILVEIGYFVTPSLSVRGIGTGNYTHGGLVFYNSDLLRQAPLEIRQHHDQLAHSSGISLGGGLSYVLTGSTEIYAAYMRQVQGRSGHKIAYSLSFGVGWSFSPQQIIRRYFPDRRVGAAETP